MKIDEATVKNLKILIARGYTDKQIALVSKFSRAFINKIRNGKKHANVELKHEDRLTFNSAEMRRLETLDKLLNMPEMWGANITENDTYYIHTLKFLGKTKKEVFNLYAHLTKKVFGSIWAKSGVDIKMLNTQKLGIDGYAYLDLIVDYFIK